MGDYDLRDAAEAAADDWYLLSKIEHRLTGQDEEGQADARFIATFDPPTVLRLLRLAELWDEQCALGTTQGGGRRYEDHCAQHAEAHRLLTALGIR